MGDTEHVAILRAGADLSGADLSGANLSRANLRNANLASANLSRANLTLADLTNAEVTNVGWEIKQMRGCYLGVRGLESCYGNALFKRDAADQDFLDALEARLRGTSGILLFRGWSAINYGRSLLRVAAVAFGLAGLYGAIYRLFPQILDFKDSAKTWFAPY